MKNRIHNHGDIIVFITIMGLMLTGLMFLLKYAAEVVFKGPRNLWRICRN